MLNFKKIFEEFNIPAQSKKYGIPLKEHPQFLFLIMGVVIILTIIGTYLLGVYYLIDSIIIALIVILLTGILFIISFLVTKTFEKLAEVNRMKTEFIGIISHQLRTPFTNLKWVIEILSSGQLDKIEKKQQLDHFQILKDNNNRIGRMIDDLLIVSRIEEKKIYFKKADFFLKDLIKDLILEFKPLAQSSNIEIKFSNFQNSEKIFTDFFLLKTVIEKFLDNAIHSISARNYYTVDAAAKEGRREIKIKIKKENKNFYLEVKDNGVGIPREDQKYIFQKFFRAINISKSQIQGTGLGLFIAKSIVEKLGGKIGLKSEEGEGSTFWITLPTK